MMKLAFYADRLQHHASMAIYYLENSRTYDDGCHRDYALDHFVVEAMEAWHYARLLEVVEGER